jgi:hypothetical protein
MSYQNLSTQTMEKIKFNLSVIFKAKIQSCFFTLSVSECIIVKVKALFTYVKSQHLSLEAWTVTKCMSLSTLSFVGVNFHHKNELNLGQEMKNKNIN